MVCPTSSSLIALRSRFIIFIYRKLTFQWRIPKWTIHTGPRVDERLVTIDLQWYLFTDMHGE